MPSEPDPCRTGFFLKISDILLMVLNHIVGVGHVERGSSASLEAPLRGLTSGIRLVRQRELLFSGDRLEVLVGLGVVRHHPLPELADLWCICVLYR